MVRIVIAAHKEAKLPEGECYLPVFVGAALHKGEDNLPPYCRDDQGENISEKNPLYCELTGLYWAWKNLDCDAIGLAHYRRHFSMKSRGYRKSAKYTYRDTATQAQADARAAELLSTAQSVIHRLTLNGAAPGHVDYLHRTGWEIASDGTVSLTLHAAEAEQP